MKQETIEMNRRNKNYYSRRWDQPDMSFRSPSMRRNLQGVRVFLSVLVLAMSIAARPATAGTGGLRWGLLEVTVDEETEATTPSASGLPSAPTPTPTPNAPASGAPSTAGAAPSSCDIVTPERQRQLVQLGALEEQQRRLQRELIRISAPDAGVERAQVVDRIRQLEQKMADRQAAHDADLQRLASNRPADRKAEEQLCRNVHDLQTRLADEQRPREAELAALREQARQLAAEDERRPKLDPVERALRQDELRAHILALEDLKRRLQNGESLPANPAVDPRSADAFEAVRRRDELERAGASPPADQLKDSRDRAEALRRQATELERSGPDDEDLSALRTGLAARGIDDPLEAKRLLAERKDELDAQKLLRARQLREEARELEDRMFLAGLEDNPPLMPGARFELKVGVSARVRFEKAGDAQQTPVDIAYRPATLTWTMGTLRWREMQSVLEGPDGIYWLEREAEQALESPDLARGPDGERTAFYRKAQAVLEAMSRVAQGSLILVRDESVPVIGNFQETSLVTWSKVEPSRSEDVPPTVVSARLQAPGFTLENAHPDRSFSYATSQVTLVQATEQTLRAIDREGEELSRMSFNTDDTDRKFLERMGKAHDGMREAIHSISSRASRNATAIGRAGGMYEMAINPLAFNNMLLDWRAPPSPKPAVAEARRMSGPARRKVRRIRTVPGRRSRLGPWVSPI